MWFLKNNKIDKTLVGLIKREREGSQKNNIINDHYPTVNKHGKKKKNIVIMFVTTNLKNPDGKGKFLEK